MELNLDIPPRVRAILDRLRAAGGEVYVVGGAVRDARLGLATRDLDIATSLVPERLADLFPGAPQAFGGVTLAEGDAVLTITTLRRDGPYLDQRHPSSIAFVDTPAEDAVRRDFTVNAIYVDPWSGAVCDPCGGQADLDDRVLRMIGDPEARLREDPLRILRAIRFAARLGGPIDVATAAAIRATAGELHCLSRERTFDELTSAFVRPGRGEALRLLVELGVAEFVLPELMAMPGVPQPPEYHPEGDVFVHTCLVLDHVREADPVQSWAAVLHDVGKPATFERAPDRIRFTGHDTLSAEMADRILDGFHVPRGFREEVVEVCRDHIRFASLPQMKLHRRNRWLRSPRFPSHLEFHRADCLGSHGKLEIYEFARDALRDLPPEPPPPLCTGADVIAAGVGEGPAVGEVLRRLEMELTERAVSDRDSALAVLREIVDSHFRPGP